jgi:hypothetical protein
MKTISTLKSIADMPVPAFNALAALNIYHFADLAWPTVRTPHLRRRALATLHLHGILTEVTDSFLEDIPDLQEV